MPVVYQWLYIQDISVVRVTDASFIIMMIYWMDCSHTCRFSSLFVRWASHVSYYLFPHIISITKTPVRAGDFDIISLKSKIIPYHSNPQLNPFSLFLNLPKKWFSGLVFSLGVPGIWGPLKDKSNTLLQKRTCCFQKLIHFWFNIYAIIVKKMVLDGFRNNKANIYI